VEDAKMASVDAKRSLIWIIIASAAALTLSPLTTILSGTVYLSALVLLPITAIVWVVTRLSRSDMGLRLGRPAHYGVALLYPIAVMGLLVCILAVTGGLHADNIDSGRTVFVIAANSGIGILGVLLTEEGLFRGLLWGLLGVRGLKRERVLLVTGLLFMIWHVPVVLLELGPDFPRSAVPMYLLNVLVIGLNWGLMRMASGSILVPAVCHSVWNAMAYKLFGFGSQAGVLSVSSWEVYGPERGILGLALNLVFFILYWRYVHRRPHCGPVVL
jgi:membrane protease YdiL (CAAX protease family)